MFLSFPEYYIHVVITVHRDVMSQGHPKALRPFIPELEAFTRHNHYNVSLRYNSSAKIFERPAYTGSSSCSEVFIVNRSFPQFNASHVGCLLLV